MDPLEQAIEELKKELGEDVITTGSNTPRPEKAIIREAFDDFNERNPLAGGGMLVQPSADGSRPGYAKEKPLIKREQNIFKNYLKARKEVGLNVPSDDNKQKIKSKIRTGTIDNQTIKNLKETYRYKNEDQRLRYDTKLKRWEKIAGRDRKTYIQKKDETKSQFLKRVENITSLSQTKARKKQDTATKKARIYIDNWTKDWLDNNLEKYGVRNFNKMITNLKKDWQKNVKTLKMDKGFLQSWSTKAGLPNVTPSREISFGLKPFNYNGVPFYTSAEVTKAPLSQWRGLFFRDKIQNIPGFRQKILDYFNFMNLDKRGLYMQEGFKTIKAYKDIADKNVVYLLSPDANLISSAKYNLFNSIDDEFSEAYNTYTKKVNKSKQWKKSAALIEKTLGLKPRYIQNSMNRERAALAKLFDVKQLPEELRYTLEHGQGLSAAASTGNKEIMERAVNDLIGTTVRQNTALGFGGFEQTRNSLIRDIRAGVNVKDNLNSLNKLVGDAYKDFGIKDKIYSIQDGQLTTRNISPATTREERFAQYFKQIDKTSEGSAAIKKQYGNLKNLLAKIGCPNKVPAASGGRIGYKDGADVCPARGLEKVRTGMQNSTPAQLKNFDKLTKSLRAIGASNIMKLGILPEVLLEGALIANKMVSEGDSFMQGARNSYLAIPFQAMDIIKTYDEGRREEILNPEKKIREDAAPLGEIQKKRVKDVMSLQDTLNEKNQLLRRIQGLQGQAEDIDAISEGSDFGYVGDSQAERKKITELRADLQDMYRGDAKGNIRRAERLLTTKPMDLNINDQLIMDAYKNAVEKANALRASKIKVAPGTGFAVDRQIKKRMDQLPITSATAKQDLKATGDFFGTGYTPLSLNKLYTLMGRQDPKFGIDKITGKYNQEQGIEDYKNYLRTLRFADNFREEKAGGGIAGLSGGIDEGPQRISMNPDSQGLSGLLKNGKKI